MTNRKSKVKAGILAAISTFLVAAIVWGVCAWQLDWFRKPIPTTYPYIFVHGLNGWGEDAGISHTLPYWGANSGNLMQLLREEGYVCHAPSVGTAGSAWDRACELYAQLTGTRVDYGAAHAEKYGHDRYGMQYSNALVPDWGSVDDDRNLRKINLIGHSFGGATIRLFAQLAANGSTQEQEAAQKNGEACSSLFQGGKRDWIFSVTTLAAPHNGTTLLYAVGDGESIISTLLSSLNFVLKTTAGKAALDSLRLFGIQFDSATAGRDLQEVLRLADTPDNAYHDLTLEGAAAVNATIHTNPNIYYYSYAVDGTKDGTLLSGRVATDDMMLPLHPLALLIGSYRKNTQSAHQLDDSWLPNDGLVNTVSQMTPSGAEHVEFAPDVPQKGVWQIMPTLRGDHGTPIGLMQTREWTLQFYKEQLERIDALSRQESGEKKSILNPV